MVAFVGKYSTCMCMHGGLCLHLQDLSGQETEVSGVHIAGRNVCQWSQLTFCLAPPTHPHAAFATNQGGVKPELVSEEGAGEE